MRKYIIILAGILFVSGCTPQPIPGPEGMQGPPGPQGEAGEVGEKVLKWFGALRPVDLDSF